MSFSILGIEIHDSALTLARVTDGRVTATAAAPLPAGVVENGRLTDAAALAKALRRLCREARIRTRRCALVLPPQLVAARRLTLPRMEATALQSQMPLEFRDYLGTEAVSWAAYTTQYREDTIELHAAALRCADGDSFRRAFQLAGLDLTAAIPREAAWGNLLARQNISGPVAVLDQNAGGVQFSVFSDGVFLMGRMLDAQGGISSQLRQAVNFFTLSTAKPITALYLNEAISVEIPGLPLLPAAALLPEGMPTTFAPAAGAALNPKALNLAPKAPLLRPRQLLLLTALLTAVLLLFAKFGLLDPLEEKARAYELLSQQQALLAEMHQRLGGFPALEQEYLRFGTGGMTESERSLVDPAEVLSLVEQSLRPAARLESMTLSGNILTLALRGISLEAAGTLVAQLEEAPLVASADIHSAESIDQQDARILLRVTLTKEAARE